MDDTASVAGLGLPGRVAGTAGGDCDGATGRLGPGCR